MAPRSAGLLVGLGLAGLARGNEATTQAQDAGVMYPVAPQYALRGCDLAKGEIWCARTRKCEVTGGQVPVFCLPEALDAVGVGSFRWGASSSAYQIEGAASAEGKGLSNWDVFVATPGRVDRNDTGDVAADSYHRYKEDVAVLAELGVQDYRFSVSWARVLPDGTGAVNAPGLEYYSRLVDELLHHGIVPVVCLFHWDLPQTLEAQGGWLNKDVIVPAFVEYAGVVFAALGDRVKTWVTLNEPGTVVFMGYNMGMHAPGRCADRERCAEGDSFREPLVAGHNMLLSHAHAVETFRREFQPIHGGRIGMVNCVKWAEPQNRGDASQWRLAQFLMEAEIGFFTDPLYFGDYPLSLRDTVGAPGGPLPQFTDAEKRLLAGSQDFFGLNFYTSHYVWDPPKGGGIGPVGGSEWLFVTPGGLRNQLHWITARYGAPPIYITENGCDQPDETRFADPAVPDHFRIAYLHEYIEQAAIAALEGVNLQGYYLWSILDNFEWADGYGKRFGVVHVDFDGDLKRTPKASFYWFKRLLSELRKSHGPGSGPGLSLSRAAGAENVAAVTMHADVAGMASAPATDPAMTAAATATATLHEAAESAPGARDPGGLRLRLATTSGLVLVGTAVALGLLVLRRRVSAGLGTKPLRRGEYDELA